VQAKLSSKNICLPSVHRNRAARNETKKQEVKMQNESYTQIDLIAIETRRLAEQHGKSFFDCEDIVKLTGLGRDNVRRLINSNALPVIRVGNRKVVSIINFVSWSLNHLKGGSINV